MKMKIGLNAISLISFDIFNTLIQPKYSIGEIYYIILSTQLVNKWGQELEQTKKLQLITLLNQRFLQTYTQFKTSYPQFGLLNNLSTEKWWLNCLEAIFDCKEFQGFDKQKLAKFVYEGFDFNYYKKLDNVVTVLNKLKEKKDKDGVLKLVVNSNMDGRIVTVLEKLNLTDYFDEIYLASDTQQYKPSPTILNHLIQKYQLKPNQLLHIGDDFKEDYEMATQQGCQALLIDSKSKYKKRINDYSVKDWWEIQKILEL